MVCIYCGQRTRTSNSRKSDVGHHIWRRRRCIECNAIFTTYEKPDLKLSIRIKDSNSLEPFISEKLFLDVYASLSHRKKAYMEAEGLVETVVLNLLPCPTGVISKSELKETTHKVLKRFNKAAATYYAAHHM